MSRHDTTTRLTLQKSMLAVSIGLLLLLDYTAAFAPTANQQPILLMPNPSRIRSRHRTPSAQLLFRNNNEEESPVSPTTTVSNDDGMAIRLHRSMSAIATSAAIFTAVLASPINIQINNPTTTPNNAISLITISPSQAYALSENQQFVADVWFAVTAQFFDPTYSGLGEDGWRLKEKEAIAAVADTGPDDEELVTKAISNMLSALNDPYTRFLPREKYEALTAYATGGSYGGGVSGGTAGIGVQLLEDPRTNDVMVMATIRGGPAASAGLRAGDVIVEVDGEKVNADHNANAEVVAAKCRGEPGSKVDVRILRNNGDDNNNNNKQSTERITLTRAKINPLPIEASTYTSDKGKRVGLLRVPSFSTNTVKEMVDGLREVESEADAAVDAIVIDIRGNVGGYMPAGVDAAKLFLPPRSHIIAEIGPSPNSIKTYDADGIGAETKLPLYLLVDKRTASAAEIFAAALQDNQRAMVVGTSNTFGKGRIQNVQPLNGSGVAVTRARYVTPKGRDLHGVGIVPNREPVGGCEMKDDARVCLKDIVDMY